MGKIKELMKYDKKIIEALIISLISGWALTSILKGACKQVGNIQYPAQGSFLLTLVMIVVCAGAFGYIYYKNTGIAKILMFVMVYIFLVSCAYEGFSSDVSESFQNSIGSTCYAAILSFVAGIAFLYVKDEFYNLLADIKLSRKVVNIIVIVIGVLLFAFIGIVTVLRYKSYANSTFDFGIFAQMYENMKQTGAIDTTLERNRLLSHFAVHFSPIFYIALPIYFVFPSAVTVQLIQALMVALPVIPIVLISRKYQISNWMTVAMVLLYALYPATAGGTMYDIHENCFLTFFILMTVWAVEKKKNYLMIIMMLLSFFVKEDAAIFVLILGVFYLFSRKDKKRGLILMVCSMVYFIIAIAVVNSYGLGVLDSRFSNLYFDSTKGFGQIIQTIIMNPGYVISQIIANGDASNMDKIEYIILMFVPMAPVIFTTGKKYSRYILLAPLVIVNLCTTYVYLHAIGFQYNFGVIALLIYLAIMNVSDRDCRNTKTLLSIAVICASIMFTGSMLPKLGNGIKSYNENKETYEKIDKALEMVPGNASVCASGFFTPHLSKNLVLYDQNHLEQPVYTDYLVVDERFDNEKEKFDEVLNSGKYEIAYEEAGLVSIYKKK